MAWGNGQQQPRSGNAKPKYQHKQNRGSIFDNDHKTTEKHPDFTGSANINGIVYWVSGWAEMSNGKRKLSLSFKQQEERPQQSAPERPHHSRGGW